MRLRTVVAAGVVAALGVAAVAPASADSASVGAYREGDTSVLAYNVLPPGQGASANALELAQFEATGARPAHFSDQRPLYEELVRRASSVTAADLPALFKDASFGVKPGDVGRVYSPRTDVAIARDLSFGVPHVYGTTRSGTMFGAGYVSGEDRLFMMDTLRHVARGRLSEFLGASPSNLASDRAQRLVADYSEDELVAMGERLSQVDPKLGVLAQMDLQNFADGVNAFISAAITDPTKLPAEYPALQLVPEPWRVTDSIALATLIGGQFSTGGGGQIENDVFLRSLESMYPPAEARAIFDDMKEANDPEAPTATETAFPYNATLSPVNPAAVVRGDSSQAVTFTPASAAPATIDGPFGPIRLRAPKPASNALLVDAAHSTDNRPIAVFGPQVGYYNPQILMEIDLHGPGIDARGAAFPGISMYVLLGRGAGYAWSATTAIADHIDVRAVKLCNDNGSPATLSSTSYLRDGVCRPMFRRTDTWVAKPSAAGIPAGPSVDAVVEQMTTERVQLGAPSGEPNATPGRAGLGTLKIGPDWAIVLGRGMAGGVPVAYARQRASYGIEVDATLSFVRLHDPARINSVSDMQHAFGDWFSFAFNWHLIDGKDMGFITTGRFPVQAAGVDPELPISGDSQWDWTRYLSFAEHPQTINEAKGWVANWNNKQAPGFRASDDWYSYGSVGRVQLLEQGIEQALAAGGGKVSPAALVGAMGKAATKDLRAVSSLQHVLDIIGTPATAPEQAAVADLTDWLADGANRRDLNFDGSDEHARAVALMDAMWNPVLDNVFKPVLGGALNLLPEGRDDAPSSGGSAFLEGWYGQLEKDLRTLLGGSVAQPYSRSYCGQGSLSACRAALIGALDKAITGADAYTAAAAQSGMTTGQALWKQDAIKFSNVGIIGIPPMAWQNRPTFQQVLEFE